MLFLGQDIWTFDTSMLSFRMAFRIFIICLCNCLTEVLISLTVFDRTFKPLANLRNGWSTWFILAWSSVCFWSCFFIVVMPNCSLFLLESDVFFVDCFRFGTFSFATVSCSSPSADLIVSASVTSCSAIASAPSWITSSFCSFSVSSFALFSGSVTYIIARNFRFVTSADKIRIRNCGAYKYWVWGWLLMDQRSRN